MIITKYTLVLFSIQSLYAWLSYLLLGKLKGLFVSHREMLIHEPKIHLLPHQINSHIGPNQSPKHSGRIKQVRPSANQLADMKPKK